MPLRNQRDERNTLTSDIIGKILQYNPDYIQPGLILQNISLYSTGLIDKIHSKFNKDWWVSAPISQAQVCYIQFAEIENKVIW